MMTLIEIAALISTALGIYCTVPYIQAILTGKTKPHQLSWLVFVIMNGIIFFSQYFSGGRESVLISLTFFIGSFIVFLLSLKKGVRITSKWDKVLFLFSLVTILIWFLTRSNEIAIWLTLLIDVFATSMIILKIKSDRLLPTFLSIGGDPMTLERLKSKVEISETIVKLYAA